MAISMRRISVVPRLSPLARAAGGVEQSPRRLRVGIGAERDVKAREYAVVGVPGAGLADTRNAGHRRGVGRVGVRPPATRAVFRRVVMCGLEPFVQRRNPELCAGVVRGLVRVCAVVILAERRSVICAVGDRRQHGRLGIVEPVAELGGFAPCDAGDGPHPRVVGVLEFPATARPAVRGVWGSSPVCGHGKELQFVGLSREGVDKLHPLRGRDLKAADPVGVVHPAPTVDVSPRIVTHDRRVARSINRHPVEVVVLSEGGAGDRQQRQESNRGRKCAHPSSPAIC